MIRCILTKPNKCKPLFDKTKDQTYTITKTNNLVAFIGDTVDIEPQSQMPTTYPNVRNFKRNPNIPFPCSLVKICKRSRQFYVAIVCNLKPFQVVLLNNDTILSLQFPVWPISSTLHIGKRIIVQLGITWADYVCDATCYTTDEIATKLFQLEHNFCPVPNPITVNDSQTLDLTHLTTFTVDSAKSTDLDDALSIDPTKNLIYVHITDVSRFIPAGSLLDQRIMERATSFYLPETTFHLNPHEIVKMCSLDPDQVRYAVSTIIPYDPVTYSIKMDQITHTRSRIQSYRRYTYEEANSSLDPHILLLNTIYLKNKQEKIIDNIIKAEGCKPTNSPTKTIKLYPENDWNLCIEFYMVLVNQYVSHYCFEKFKNTIHRKHPLPQNQEEFDFIKSLMKESQSLDYPAEMWLLLQSLCMELSYYTPNEVGHFALNKPFYTHSTSPLRRYVDLVVQRVLVGDATYSIHQLEIVSDIANRQHAKRRQIDDTVLALKDLERKKVGMTLTGVVTRVSRNTVNVYLIDETRLVKVDVPTNLTIKQFSFVRLTVSEVFNKVIYKVCDIN